jgi:hypothetical protein
LAICKLYLVGRSPRIAVVRRISSGYREDFAVAEVRR